MNVRALLKFPCGKSDGLINQSQSILLRRIVNLARRDLSNSGNSSIDYFTTICIYQRRGCQWHITSAMAKGKEHVAIMILWNSSCMRTQAIILERLITFSKRSCRG